MDRIEIYIAIIAVVFIFNAVRIAIRASDHHFECPDCGESFQVNFFHFMFTIHSFDRKCDVKCPKCGKTHMLKPLRGKR